MPDPHPVENERTEEKGVEVRMQTAGKGWPTLVKKLLSSGSVPESETTTKAFIWRLL